MTRISADMSKNKSYHYFLNEHRVTLEDSIFNFLGLYESQVLNYLNFDDKFEETPINNLLNPHFHISLNLSKKIK